jgi:hypothetical protein
MSSAVAGISRIAIAAVVAELLAMLSLVGVIVFVYASEPLSFGQGERLAREIANWVIPIAGFVPCLLAAWWAVRKLLASQVQRGIAVGVAAVILDIAFLVWLGAPFRFVFVIAVIGRIAGGGLGGLLASRRAARKEAIQPFVAA